MVSFRKTMEKLRLIELEHLYVEISYISGKVHAPSEFSSKIEDITFAISKQK